MVNSLFRYAPPTRCSFFRAYHHTSLKGHPARGSASLSTLCKKTITTNYNDTAIVSFGVTNLLHFQEEMTQDEIHVKQQSKQSLGVSLATDPLNTLSHTQQTSTFGTTDKQPAILMNNDALALAFVVS